MSEPVRLIAAEDRTSPPGAQTPGMSREQAVATDDYWMGVVTAEPETSSGWHHHSEHDSYIYVIDGTGTVDFGPGGMEVIQASVDDIIHVPKGVVHRERTSQGLKALVVRVGSGLPVVNVDGPDPVA